ncbi:MAG: rod shape-determining protein MreD [Lachnospiraceae bacterium]|nr:rod shape-determining protein MreD [Lachnospiraceae bacterium]
MRRFKRIFITALIILAGFLLQFGLFANSPLIDTVPNILLIITVAFGFMNGKNQGMAVGVACGFLMDVASISTVGFHMAIFILIGYVNGVLHQWLYSDYILFPLFVTALCSLFYGGYFYVFQFLIRNRLNFVYYLLHIILPEVIYTTVLTSVIYQIISSINYRLEESERRSAAKFV